MSSNESDSQFARIENSCAGFGKLIRDHSADRMSATDQPPSTSRLVPVISADAGDARNTTAAATSFGSPTRPTGMLARVRRLKSGSARAGAVPSV